MSFSLRPGGTDVWVCNEDPSFTIENHGDEGFWLRRDSILVGCFDSLEDAESTAGMIVLSEQE